MNRRRLLSVLAALSLMGCVRMPVPVPAAAPAASPLTFQGVPLIPDLVRPDHSLAIGDTWLTNPRYQARLENVG